MLAYAFERKVLRVERIIFHIDVNSAFLSWEAARRVSQGMEDIRLIPSAIGGDRDKRTGVILAKSIPAKKYGVKTGEPVSAALRKCPDLYIVKPDFSLYESKSRAFISICREYTPVVEKFSIDECFLDMTGMNNIFPDLIKTAYEIKDRIKCELGFTVNIGIGNNKLLAKMASDFEKPDKVHTLYVSEIKEKMWPLPIRDLFSVGAATAEKLDKAGVKRIGDLATLDLLTVKSLVGDKIGEHIYNYANGIDNFPVAENRERAKGYSNSITLEYDVKNMIDAQQILLVLVDSVATRMRTDGARASCVGVTIRDLNFHDMSHQKKFSIPTDITGELFDACKLLLSELWNKKKPLRLIGVSLTDIVFEEDLQISFFESEKRDKARKIDKTVDNLRTKFGKSIIVRGGAYRTNSDDEIKDENIKKQS